MEAGDLVVIPVVVAALSFDFTNGFHDTANAMATTIATGALRPRVAVTVAAILNFIGAFISLKTSTTLVPSVWMMRQPPQYGLIWLLGGGAFGTVVVGALAVVGAVLLWIVNRKQAVAPEETVSENPAFGAAPRPRAVAA